MKIKDSRDRYVKQTQIKKIEIQFVYLTLMQVLYLLAASMWMEPRSECSETLNHLRGYHTRNPNPCASTPACGTLRTGPLAVGL